MERTGRWRCSIWRNLAFAEDWHLIPRDPKGIFTLKLNSILGSRFFRILQRVSKNRWSPLSAVIVQCFLPRRLEHRFFVPDEVSFLAVFKSFQVTQQSWDIAFRALTPHWWSLSSEVFQGNMHHSWQDVWDVWDVAWPCGDSCSGLLLEDAFHYVQSKVGGFQRWDEGFHGSRLMGETSDFTTMGFFFRLRTPHLGNETSSIDG